MGWRSLEGNEIWEMKEHAFHELSKTNAIDISDKYASRLEQIVRP